ncbi:MAG: hypothetical protein ACNS62_14240 [Candidatus Cyclobacteriaceae bacterium M3_2C_046]
MKRREFVKMSSLAAAALPVTYNPLAAFNTRNVPVRAITGGPKFHWFGYYDKLQFDPTNKLVLGMEVDFEHRTPEASDVIKVGMVDTEHGDKWIELGQSSSWGWQQGCMLQWIPNSGSEIIWNDRQDGQFVSHIMDVHSGKKRTLPKPVYALSQDGEWAIGADFARIQNLRPGYGYKGVSDPYQQVNAPEESGIYRINLKTGQHQLVIPIAKAAAIPYDGQKLDDKWHYFNHLLVSPDSERFIFLHRWRDEPTGHYGGGFTTRMFTADKNGNDLYILDPSGYTSHFIWKDPQHVCAWTKPEGEESAFYLFKDKTEQVEIIGKEEMVVNGHNTYLPQTSNEWILNDTYPQGPNREQIPYIYHVPTRKKLELGRFHSPEAYKGEWRCDTHPRSSNDGKKVVIDSPHQGGRQMYLMDIEELLNIS